MMRVLSYLKSVKAKAHLWCVEAHWFAHPIAHRNHEFQVHAPDTAMFIVFSYTHCVVETMLPDPQFQHAAAAINSGFVIWLSFWVHNHSTYHGRNGDAIVPEGGPKNKPTKRARIGNAKSEPRQSGLTLCVPVSWPEFGLQKRAGFIVLNCSKLIAILLCV